MIVQLIAFTFNDEAFFSGRSENFAEDFTHLLSLNNLTHLLPSQHLAAKTNKKPHGENRTKKLFAQLTPWQRRKIYEFYRIDFDMFGYSHREFM